MEKFNLHKFLIKITSRKLWCWLLSSYFIQEILFKEGDKPYFIPIVICWGVITVVYLIGDPIEQAISRAIEKAEVKFQMNNSISTSIDAKANLGGR